MAQYLLCSTPVHGHVVPMTSIGRHLVSLGHRVTMLTGSRFEDRVRASGMDFRPLRGRADYDDRDNAATLPDRDRYRGLAQAQYDIQTLFVATIPAQYRSVRALLDELRPDAVLTDTAFAGVTPWLFAGPEGRPPMLGVGVTPLTQLGRDVAPSGMALPPSSTRLGRIRNRSLNVLASKVLFRPTQRVAERMFAEIGAPKPSMFVMDVSRAFDRFLQLSAREFEYPRSDLSENVRFVGALPSDAAPPATASPSASTEGTGVGAGAGTDSAAASELPSWWPDLRSGAPVVHVTQGTIDNHDLDRLIRPTITALAQLPVTVVVTMGGRPTDALGPAAPLPGNVRVASYLPYDELLPLTDVFVTNGGYGGVQQALGAGVPLVVAGGTEDKPEVAARVGWAGVGVDLRTGTPTPDAVYDAVLATLSQPDYRSRAQALAATMARYDALATIDGELTDAVARTLRARVAD